MGEARGNVVLKALCYKLEGRGVRFHVIEFFFFFNLPNPSSRTMALGLASLTEMFQGCKGLPERKADLIAICEPIA
jgi:hypothetical protein